MKDRYEVVKKHCTCSELDDLFGRSVGFPSGVDIFNCDFFRPAGHRCSDVTYLTTDGKRVSFIVPSDRPKSRLGAGDLKDNSQNQRVHKLKSVFKQLKIS